MCLKKGAVRQIAYNAGYEGSIVIDRLKNAELGTGFNAATGEWVNMIEAGFIDPDLRLAFGPSKRSFSSKSYLDNRSSLAG